MSIPSQKRPAEEPASSESDEAKKTKIDKKDDVEVVDEVHDISDDEEIAESSAQKEDNTLKEAATEAVEKAEFEKRYYLTEEEQKEREKEKEELMAVFARCQELGGPNFVADQEKVLAELTKQKETIKKLLDELRETKKERKPRPQTNEGKRNRKTVEN
ncbi:hypothetical protein CRE_15645 [Caenorhabditis remanei]|uniref:Uncharacterized protein n=1 Tax=Caenorhabditis remanei TaxID=31234 RepID=E3N844_CAERE|nr:hypothetical protein CRE_15645 [Caenorhabditis remanei]